jgi:hypothetical protein
MATRASTFASIGIKLKTKGDYPRWAKLQEGLLEGEALKRYAIEELDSPLRTRPIKKSAEDEDDYQDRLDIHNGKMAKAFTCIFINLSTEIQEACMHITTASELWTWIKNKFGQSTVSEEYQLYLDWENYHFDGGSVHTFGTGY